MRRCFSSSRLCETIYLFTAQTRGFGVQEIVAKVSFFEYWVVSR